MKKLRRLLMLVLLSALLALAGGAVAEELPEMVEGELFWLGDLPTHTMPVYPTRDGNDFEEYLVSNLKDLETVIDFTSYRLSLDDFYNAFFSTLNEHPELFYVYSYRAYRDGDRITYVLPVYLYDGEENQMERLEARIDFFEEEVDKLADYARRTSSKLGQLLLLNDYFCANYEYDTSFTVVSPDDFFETGKGVCQAYMLAYKAVLDELGFNSTCATSWLMNHTWNMVKLQGSWYHIDVTWNDPTSDMPLRARHEHFLRSDAGIMKSGHYGWSASVRAENDEYDEYFWQGIDTPIPVLGKWMYYVDNNYESYYNRAIMKRSLTNDETEEVHNFARLSGGAFYPGYDPIAVDAQRIYYVAGNNLCSVAHNSNEEVLEQVLTDGTEYAFSCFLNGSTISVYLAADYATAGRVVTIDLNNSFDIVIGSALQETVQNETVQMSASLEPAVDFEIPFSWSSDDETIATVDENGLVTAVGTGVAHITAAYGGAESQMTIVVHSGRPLVLPAGVVRLDAEAFAHAAMQEVVLPEGITAIGEHTFADCEQLHLINLPDTLESIADDAFEHSAGVVVLCTENSPAHTFAQTHDLPFVLIPVEEDQN